MPAEDGAIEIVVCLGSSCFARGNSEILAVLQQYVQDTGPRAAVRLAGCLCQDQCKQGPNLTIGGDSHHGITTEKLRELLEQLGSPLGRDHGTI
jgi:NADH:ubiquinone oxidoreductase subunit E